MPLRKTKGEVHACSLVKEDMRVMSVGDDDTEGRVRLRCVISYRHPKREQSKGKKDCTLRALIHRYNLVSSDRNLDR